MIITFDKGRTTERFLNIDHYSENVLQNRMNCNANLHEADYPDLTLFNDVNFSAMEISKNGKPIRFSGHYNTITALSISYDEMTDNYSMSLSLAGTNGEKE